MRIRSARAVVLLPFLAVACGGGSGNGNPSPGVIPQGESAQSPSSPRGGFSIVVPGEIVVRAGAEVEIAATLDGDVEGAALAVGGLSPGLTAAIDGARIVLTAAADAKLGDASLVVTADVAGATKSASMLVVVAGKAGEADPTFGQAGRVEGPSNFASVGLAVDGAGRTLVSGHGPAGQVVLRYDTRGEPDPTFHGTGAALISEMENMGPLVALPDGSVIVAGTVTGGHPCVFKLDESGARVDGFGVGGRACVDATTKAAIDGVRVLDDGSVVVGGSIDNNTGSDDFFAAKVTAGGDLDASFGTNGLARLVRPDIQYSYAMDVDSKGRVLVVGGCADADRACAWRMNAYGQSDPFFDGGVALFPAGAYAHDFLVTDGDAIVAPVSGSAGIRLASVSASGKANAAFGVAGVVEMTPFVTAPSVVRLARDGERVLGVGWFLTPGGDRLFIGRFQADGTADASFGNAGFARLDDVEATPFARIAVRTGRAVALASRFPNDGFKLVSVWR